LLIKIKTFKFHHFLDCGLWWAKRSCWSSYSKK